MPEKEAVIYSLCDGVHTVCKQNHEAWYFYLLTPKTKKLWELLSKEFLEDSQEK